MSFDAYVFSKTPMWKYLALLPLKHQGLPFLYMYVSIFILFVTFPYVYHFVNLDFVHPQVFHGSS